MKLLKIIGAAAFASMVAISAKAEEVNILFNNFVPPTFFMYDVVPDWAKEIEAATEGRVTMNIPAKSLAPPPEQWNGVENHVFDGAWMFNGFIANRISLPLISMVPWTSGENSEATSVALWRTYEKYFAEKNEYEGMKLLGLFTLAGSELYSQTDTPVTSMADLGSRKVWTLPGSPTVAAKASGAGVVSSPATQVHEYVSRNVTSAFFGISKSASHSYKAAPYAKSITTFPSKIYNPSFSIFIRKDVWDRISPEDQAAIEAVSGEALARKIGAIATSLELEAKQKYIDAGVPFIAASDEFYAEMRAATASMEADWIAKADALGVDGQAALDFYTAEVARLEAGG